MKGCRQPKLFWVVVVLGLAGSVFLGLQCQRDSTAIPSMTPRRALGAAQLNEQIYAIGGWNQTTSQLDLVEVLDLATAQWRVGPSLQVARSQHGVVAVDGRLWVLGGWNAEQGLVSAVERLSPGQTQWEVVTHLPTPRREPGVARLGRSLVVAGGFDGASDADLDGYSNRVEAFDLDQGQWQQLANLGTPRRGLALVNVHKRLFAIGGYTAEGGFTNVAEVYDAANNHWQQLPWSLTPRTWTATAAADGVILIAGGYNQDGFLGLVERVDPHTGQVCYPSPLATPRAWFVAVSTTEGLLALGGETAVSFTGTVEVIATRCS